MLSMDETNSHNWGEKPETQSYQGDAFTEGGRTNSEPTRNDARSCKTVSAATRAYFSEANVRRRLLVFATQVERGGLDFEDRAALLPYVKREMGR